MIAYSSPKRSDLYTPFWSKLLENHTLHSGTYLYGPYMAVPHPPWGVSTLIFFSLGVKFSGTSSMGGVVDIEWNGPLHESCGVFYDCTDLSLRRVEILGYKAEKHQATELSTEVSI